MTANVHVNMSFEDYCRLDGINASAIKGVGGCSPRHLKAYLDGDIESTDTKDKRLGRAIHCMILEPEHFETRFPMVEQCWATVKGDAKKGTEDHRCKNIGTRRNNDLFYCGVHGKQYDELDDYVTADERKNLNGLEFALKDAPCSRLLKAKNPMSELVIQWEQFGHLLKTRIDRLAFPTPMHAITFDIKKMQVGAGSDDDVRDECARRGYHIQGWFHRSGVKAAFPDVVDIEQYFLFIEDSYPFADNTLPFDDEDMMIAEHQIKSKLEVFASCKASGRYHGYQMEIVPDKSGILPGWFKGRFDEQLFGMKPTEKQDA